MRYRPTSNGASGDCLTPVVYSPAVAARIQIRLETVSASFDADYYGVSRTQLQARLQLKR